MKLVVLLSLVASVLGCGIHLPKNDNGANDTTMIPRFRRMIVGGANVTDPGKWPWQVLLMFNLDDFLESGAFCGGTIVDEQWVLTAAHCLENMNISRISVFAGATNWKNVKEKYYRRVIDAIVHPEYDERLIMNDIAILKLNSPFAFDDVVSSICIPNPSQSIPNDGQAVVTGVGRTDVDINGTRTAVSQSSLQLREAIVPIIDPEVCKDRWSHLFPGHATAHLIIWKKRSVVCASSLAHGPHKGDSGGPLMMKASNGRWFQIGIFSFFHCESDDCRGSESVRGDLYPKAFTDVRKYCKWIEESTGGDVNCYGEEVVLEDAGIAA